MGQYLIKPTKLKGEICVPPSKSHTLRALLFSAMAKGKSVIYNSLLSPDAFAMIKAISLFGSKVDVFTDRIEIQGLNGEVPYAEDVIDAGNSGIVLRFCSAIGALAKHPVVITGDHSIRYQRSMKDLLIGLSQLGVKTFSMRGDDYAPVIIQGPLRSGKATISGDDSQPVSALLIASAFTKGEVEIVVQHPGEKSWIALTLHWFDILGIPYTNFGFERYCLCGHAAYAGFIYEVPGDFSSAAFPIAAALVTRSELMVKNIDMDDPQGDKELIHVFQKMGAHIEIKDKTLYVYPRDRLFGVSVDINNFADAITILAVVACFAEGETHIKNAAVTRQKECDRIHCIAIELKKMGADITEQEDGLIIRQSTLRGAHLHSFYDHRMAMSLAVAAMGAEGESIIEPVECVAKTFPSFVRDFVALGASIEHLA